MLTEQLSILMADTSGPDNLGKSSNLAQASLYIECVGDIINPPSLDQIKLNLLPVE